MYLRNKRPRKSGQALLQKKKCTAATLFLRSIGITELNRPVVNGSFLRGRFWARMSDELTLSFRLLIS